MHYGYPPHIPSPQDRTVVACKCGWCSPEMNKEEFGKLGVPWYCDDCGSIVTRFATFHPFERFEAYKFLLNKLCGETVDDFRDRLRRLVAERGQTS